MRMPFLTLCAVLAAAATAAQAEETAPQTGAFDWSGEIGAVSDYRWRGVSLTGNDAAIQGGITVAHESGVYAGAWAAAPTRNSGDLEVDLYVGDYFSVGGGDLDLSLVGYIYPDLDDTDYVNGVATYTHPIGPASVRARFEYAPMQDNLADESVYAALEGEFPIAETGFTALATVGWEEGYFTLDGEKWDYSLGAQYTKGAVTLALNYVDTDEDAPPGDEDTYEGGVVFSILAKL
jgi:uncharacterized protein (TIGR02001 family)